MVKVFDVRTHYFQSRFDEMTGNYNAIESSLKVDPPCPYYVVQCLWCAS